MQFPLYNMDYELRRPVFSRRAMTELMPLCIQNMNRSDLSYSIFLVQECQPQHRQALYKKIASLTDLSTSDNRHFAVSIAAHFMVTKQPLSDDIMQKVKRHIDNSAALNLYYIMRALFRGFRDFRDGGCVSVTSAQSPDDVTDGGDVTSSDAQMRSSSRLLLQYQVH